MVFKDSSDSTFYQQFSLLSLRLWLNLGSIENRVQDHFPGSQQEGKEGVIQERGKSTFKGVPCPMDHNFARSMVRA